MTNWSADALEKKNTTVRVCVCESDFLFLERRASPVNDKQTHFGRCDMKPALITEPRGKHKLFSPFMLKRY